MQCASYIAACNVLATLQHAVTLRCTVVGHIYFLKINVIMMLRWGGGGQGHDANFSMNFKPSFLMSYMYIYMPLSSSPGLLVDIHLTLRQLQYYGQQHTSYDQPHSPANPMLSCCSYEDIIEIGLKTKFVYDGWRCRLWVVICLSDCFYSLALR